MLNEELENDVNSKKILIDDLQTEIIALKDKIISFEIKLTPAVSVEPSSSLKRLHHLPGKELK